MFNTWLKHICMAADDGGGGGVGEPTPTPEGGTGPEPDAPPAGDGPAPAGNEPQEPGSEDKAADGQAQKPTLKKHKSIFDAADDDDPKGDGEDGAGDGAGGEGDKPVEYKFELAEGLEMSDETGAKLTAIGNKHHLSQEAMNDILKLHGDVMYDTMNAAEEQYDSWLTECKKQGLTSKESLANCTEALKVFGDNIDESGEPEVQRVLVESGMMNHPAVQRFIQRIGGLLREDNPPAANGGTQKKQDIGKTLFYNSQYK